MELSKNNFFIVNEDWSVVIWKESITSSTAATTKDLTHFFHTRPTTLRRMNTTDMPRYRRANSSSLLVRLYHSQRADFDARRMLLAAISSEKEILLTSEEIFQSSHKFSFRCGKCLRKQVSGSKWIQLNRNLICDAIEVWFCIPRAGNWVESLSKGFDLSLNTFGASLDWNVTSSVYWSPEVYQQIDRMAESLYEWKENFLIKFKSTTDAAGGR